MRCSGDDVRRGLGDTTVAGDDAKVGEVNVNGEGNGPERSMIASALASVAVKLPEMRTSLPVIPESTTGSLITVLSTTIATCLFT